MEDAEQGIYSIGAVSRMLGLERATIRNWEERFGQVVPERSAGGQRLFSREDLERLRFVAGLVAGGMSPSAAHESLEEYLVQGRSLVTDGQRTDVQVNGVARRARSAGGEPHGVLPTHGGIQRCERVRRQQARSQYGQVRPGLAIVDLLIDAGAGLSLCAR